MALTDQQLTLIIEQRGYAKVMEIRSGEPITRSRAVLRNIEARLNDGDVLSLLEKRIASQAEPYENCMYRQFEGRTVRIPKVLYNTYDAAGQEGVLLLEDLSPTHRNIADWDAPLQGEHVHKLLELVAEFHAGGWEQEGLVLPEHLQSTEHYLEHLGYLERDYAHFRQYYPYHLGDEEYKLYEDSLCKLREQAEGHIRRIHSGINTAWIHGDMNACNVLYPTAPAYVPYLIDLEAVRVGLCTEDLVMLFVHDFFHGGAETLEIARQYYEILNHRLQGRYSREIFMADLRWSLMEGLFFPLKLFTHHGVQDKELLWKSINACRFLSGAAV